MQKEELFDSLAKVTVAERVADFHHADLESKWFVGGSGVGPAVRYFAANGADLGPPKSYRGFGRVCYPHDERLRKEHGAETGTLPNLLRLRVMSDGSWQGGFEYDPNVEIEEEKRERRILGDADYEYYKRVDAERARARAAMLADESPPAPPKASNQTMTAPELLGFIKSELAKDLPVDWTMLEVEGEVWFENGQRSISAIYHFMTPSGERHRFVATNTFGPMNAFGKLHENLRPDGKEWRKLKLQFKNGSDEVMADAE